MINTQAVGVIGDIEGHELSVKEQEFLKRPELSGIILFARNYAHPEQLKQLTAHILAIRPDLLICADQEGGRVQRFRDGFTRLPPMLNLENLYLNSPDKALNLAQELGWLMASELNACQVHLSFAPVLDLHYGVSSVIGNRAFASDAKTVALLAGAFIAGMQQAGMAAVGKHFPGHGAVSADSHVALPIDERSQAEIAEDIAPFKALIEQQKLAGIMPAHVIYSKFDAQHTAGFSSFWLKQVLRAELGFTGVIFSDDLSMAGAAHFGDYAVRARAAIAAGANALLVCNKPDACSQVLDEVQKLNSPHLDLSAWQTQTRAVDDNRRHAIISELSALGWL